MFKLLHTILSIAILGLIVFLGMKLYYTVRVSNELTKNLSMKGAIPATCKASPRELANCMIMNLPRKYRMKDVLDVLTNLNNPPKNVDIMQLAQDLEAVLVSCQNKKC